MDELCYQIDVHICVITNISSTIHTVYDAELGKAAAPVAAEVCRLVGTARLVVPRLAVNSLVADELWASQAARQTNSVTFSGRLNRLGSLLPRVIFRR